MSYYCPPYKCAFCLLNNLLINKWFNFNIPFQNVCTNEHFLACSWRTCLMSTMFTSFHVIPLTQTNGLILNLLSMFWLSFVDLPWCMCKQLINTMGEHYGNVVIITNVLIRFMNLFMTLLYPLLMRLVSTLDENNFTHFNHIQLLLFKEVTLCIFYETCDI